MKQDILDFFPNSFLGGANPEDTHFRQRAESRKRRAPHPSHLHGHGATVPVGTVLVWETGAPVLS